MGDLLWKYVAYMSVYDGQHLDVTLLHDTLSARLMSASVDRRYRETQVKISPHWFNIGPLYCKSLNEPLII